MKTLENENATFSEVVNALAQIFNSTNWTGTTLDLIESGVDRLNGTVNITVQNGFIMSQRVLTNTSDLVVGATFLTGKQGTIVTNASLPIDLDKNITAGIVFRLQPFVRNISFVRALVIDQPDDYRNINDTGNGKLASSVIIAQLEDQERTLITRVNISLYLRPIQRYLGETPAKDAQFYCAFYDRNSNSWNGSGCSKPIYNATYDRYECDCDHLTSFALIFLPRGSESERLTAEDIASLVFQSLSIASFLAVIIHTIYSHLSNPKFALQVSDLLSLTSSGVTMLLFIFYIALALTVYTSKSSTTSGGPCFLSASVLMFFVYFLLILMFCIKTSVAYFNYVRFVLLFPFHPSENCTCCSVYPS